MNLTRKAKSNGNNKGKGKSKNAMNEKNNLTLPAVS
jgi:hypothetical protein